MLELGRETAWPAVGEATAAAAGSRAGGEAVGGGGGGGRGDWWGGGGEPEGCRSSAGESLLLVCLIKSLKKAEKPGKAKVTFPLILRPPCRLIYYQNSQ